MGVRGGSPDGQDGWGPAPCDLALGVAVGVAVAAVCMAVISQASVQWDKGVCLSVSFRGMHAAAGRGTT